MELTPKEYAKIIYDEFYIAINDPIDIFKIKSNKTALRCSLICVEQILETDPMLLSGCTDSGSEYKDNCGYWEEVKKELYNIYKSC